MTDVFDRAQEREALDRAAAIEHERAHYPTQPWQLASACECAGCGETIPDARREAIPGVQLCVDCQTEAERHARQYMRRP